MIEDARRLIADCKKDRAMLDEFLASGPRGFERLAALKGYDCTLKELSAAIGSVELSDEQLRHIIGGPV